MAREIEANRERIAALEAHLAAVVAQQSDHAREDERRLTTLETRWVEHGEADARSHGELRASDEGLLKRIHDQGNRTQEALLAQAEQAQVAARLDERIRAVERRG